MIMKTDDYDLIKAILPKLNASRADDYESWLSVGMALYHAGKDCSVWDEWSRQSSKYRAGACEQKWRSFSSSSGSTLGVGSLVDWARSDGFDPYEDKPIDWNDVLDTPAPAAAVFGRSDLIRYLQAVFKEGDTFNYVTDTYEREEKFLPASKGICRKVSEVIAELQRYDDITYAIGDYNRTAGAWVRFNPIKENCSGSKNEDVAEYRHVLIESDSMPLDAQLSTIKRLRLPCSAIVNSGGKSVHAIVKIDAGNDLKLYKERVAFLFERLEKEKFVVDKQCKNPSRLSRLAGVWRGAAKQYLIATNEGCLSWAEWEAEIKANDFEFNELSFDELYNTANEDKSDNLLGNRFLTREGSWLIVAQSGIGKSVLAIQASILFALGRDLWGLKPTKPLKVAIVQAENNKLDLVEPLHSICENLQLTDKDRKTLQENFSVFPNSSECGRNFGRLLERIAKTKKPDIVVVDPLLSYIGGDISKQETCSAFLRNTVHPILQKYQFGLIIMHHTGKPRGKDEEQSGNALSYAGTGSSELTNYVRAASTIFQNKNDSTIYDFTHAKRGKRTETENVIYLKQGTDGNIFWARADEPPESVKVRSKTSKYANLGFEDLEPCTHAELIDKIKDVIGGAEGSEIDDKKASNIRKAMLKSGLIIYNQQTGKYQGEFVWEQ